MDYIIIRSLHKGRRKLSENRGLSMVEMLLCVLILLLSTGVTVSTLDLGIRHFKARTRETEQRLLCNTLSLAVQEYLTYANKIEVNADGTLNRFKTGAVGALENRWCTFVTGFYKLNSNHKIKFEKNPSGVTDGALAIEYRQNESAQSYDLADSSQYIAKKKGSDVDIRLKAILSVEVDSANKRFKVTISVKNEDGDTQPAINEFIVIPINPNAILSP